MNYSPPELPSACFLKLEMMTNTTIYLGSQLGSGKQSIDSNESINFNGKESWTGHKCKCIVTWHSLICSQSTDNAKKKQHFAIMHKSSTTIKTIYTTSYNTNSYIHILID